MSNHYSFDGDEMHEGSTYEDCPDCNPTYLEWVWDGACFDADGNFYPEHDFDEASCRRCDAEPEE